MNRERKYSSFLDTAYPFLYAKIMDLEHISWRMFFIRLLEIVVIVNIAVLDVFALQSFPHYTASTIIAKDSPTPTLPMVINSLDETPTPFPTPFVQTAINQTTGIKEIFIPLGTGQSNASAWTDVPEAIVSIDSDKYANINQAAFEAAMTVPTANEVVWIRLFNTTDGHPVWYSEMSMTGASQFLTSQPISLDAGVKTYQVQIKTQLQYLANLTESRIHITLK